MRPLFRTLIRYRWAVMLCALGLALTGAWVAIQTPIDAVPDLSENQVLVYAQWLGHDPPEIEEQITRPLSHGLQGIPGVRTIRGSSDVGFSLLHLIFEDNISFTEARTRVRRQLDVTQIAMPAGVAPVLAAEAIPTGQIFWYTVEGSQTDLVELRELQDKTIAPQLQTVPGVAEVASVGGFSAESHVAVDLSQLEKRKIPYRDFESALSKALPASTPTQADIESLLLSFPGDRQVRLSEVAQVIAGVGPRQGVFEKDGNEVVAGIVHLQYGFNPLEVTRAVRQKLRQIAAGLPPSIELIPCYDRSPLITGAIQTVSRTLLESILVTTICIFAVLRHGRTSLVITLTLPLAILGAFLGMSALRMLGVADVQTNIMSLAGIVVSIGVLVDSSIVVAENVSHELRKRFGDQPVTGDVSDLIADACATVARPAFFAVLMMIVSFLPIFLLEGVDGRMYRPLAWTKTLALLSVAVLTVTVVPVLCSWLIRGQLKDESDSWVVRSVVSVYRPVMQYLLDRPWPLAIILAITLILAATATGLEALISSTTLLAVVLVWWLSRTTWKRIAGTILMLAVALTAQQLMTPIRMALRFPLDEGMVMDMPITIPRISISQAVDDLKARNMVLCRFPEVHMVTGKAGRADTPFDPAPVDMIETMVEFRPQSWWPARRLREVDATRETRRVLNELTQAKLIEPPSDTIALIAEVTDAGLMRFDAIQRELAWHELTFARSDLTRLLTMELVGEVCQRWSAATGQPLLSAADQMLIAESLPARDRQRLGQLPEHNTVDLLQAAILKNLETRSGLGPVVESELLSIALRVQNRWRGWSNLSQFGLADELLPQLQRSHDREWRKAIGDLNSQIRKRAPATWTHLVCSELFARVPIIDPDLSEKWKQVLSARYGTGKPLAHHGGSHVGLPSTSQLPIIDPHPAFDELIERCVQAFSREVWLWPHDAQSLTQSGGEMDRSVQMPGWANVWTRPIQNRVDMLSTGVNSEIGIRVLGKDFDQVVETSERVAEFVRALPGAANVVADPIRGKRYRKIETSPDQLSRSGISARFMDELLQTTTAGRLIGKIADGSAVKPLRLKIRGGSVPEDQFPNLWVADTENGTPIRVRDLSRTVVKDGPATIKSENGWMRNYVRLNVAAGSATDFVKMAQQQIAQSLPLPEGVQLEWTGQFEHAVRTRQAMFWLIPLVVGLIVAILYWTFRDWADTGLMLLAVPGALAGGILCQWGLGFPYTMAVGVGYIACFGMAAATSMVMLVYLREAVAQSGGLEQMTLEDLRSAVLAGAVHRLRPKLLTEATTILSLAPMLWSTGAGADVIRPMAAPVLGGILIADEVVDLLLPVAFYAIRRRRWRSLHQSPLS